MRCSDVHSHNATALCVLGKRSLLGVALGLMLVVAGPQQAQAQVSCEEALTRARDLFERQADFEAARNLLEQCTKQDAFTKEESPEILKLLVRIYDAMDLEGQVKTALAKLFELVPNYEPGLEDPPSYQRLVNAFKRELQATAEEAPVVERPPGEQEEVTPSVETAESQREVALAQAPSEAIRNAQLRQEDEEWVISYDLVGSAKKYEVRLLLSTDGGRSFEALPQAVVGDVGKGIRPGADKQMAWMTVEDFPQGLTGGPYRLQVVAEKQGGKTLLYVLGGAVVAGGGATLALLLGGDSGKTPLPGIPSPPGRPGGN